MSSACSATVLVMYLGKIIESGPVEAVFDKPAHPCTKGVGGGHPVA
jgi:ABC-type dipeptide/oligopeptide/nickel transport system ATPase component